jgi:hypothetical protein
LQFHVDQMAWTLFADGYEKLQQQPVVAVVFFQYRRSCLQYLEDGTNSDIRTTDTLCQFTKCHVPNAAPGSNRHTSSRL